MKLTYLGLLSLLGYAVLAAPALAQCPAAPTYTAAAGKSYQLTANQSLYIPAGVTVQNVTIAVLGDNVTICNAGTILNSYNGAGIINVASTTTGTVINNLGILNSQTLKFFGPVTLTNGSADGGATVVGTATAITGFTSVDGEPVALSAQAAGSTYVNYASWGGQFRRVPAGITIANQAGASWSADIYALAGPATITNAGTWNNQLTSTAPASSLSVSNAGTGTWQGQLSVTGVGTVTLRNAGSWTAQALVASGSSLALSNTGTWSGGVYATGVDVVRGSNAGTYSGQFSAQTGSSLTLSNSGSWAGYVNSQSMTATAITNTSSWTGSQVNVTGNATLSISNSGSWASYVKNADGGNTTIDNQGGGSWTGSQVNYGGLLTLTQSGSPWTTTELSAANPARLNLTVNTSWSLGLDLPTGPNQLTIASGATMTLPAGKNLTFGSVSSITNGGTLNLYHDYTVVPSRASISNLAGAALHSTGGLSNYGAITNGGTFTTSGSSTGGQAFINGTGGTFQNSGTVTNAGDFTNTGTFSGPAAPGRGYQTVSGVSQNSGSYATSGQLDFCDTSTPAGYFDQQTGTVGSGAALTYCSLAPLPVELTSFTATVSGEVVLLRWATASELHSARFVVERSADGRGFGPVAVVAAQGTSLTATAYAAPDLHPLPGRSYYRLRQEDLDGTVAYSPVVAVVLAVAAPQLYPNPTADALTLTLPPGTDYTEVRVFSTTGNLLLTTPLSSSLSLRPLPTGLYLVQLSSPSGSRYVQRVAKL